MLAAGLFLAAMSGDAKIAPWLEGRLSVDHEESFLVLFDDPESLEATLAGTDHGSARGRGVYQALVARARSSQAAVRAELAQAGIAFRPLYVVNGLAVRGNLTLARKLAAHAEVVRIVGDPVVHGVTADLLAPVPLAPDVGPELGITQIEADKVWNLDGKRGEGVVVASGDTGVEWTHPALKGKYRGWNGTTANHDFNWFDAIEDTTEPFDDNNHGSHTTGTMVGDDGAGNQIGVAPGARWIACRNMNFGDGQPSTYIACNQFFLAPFPHGGDPELDGDPSKAPDIVNNSWECPPSEGCDANVLKASFTALRAAGILAVAGAANSGPDCSSVSNPPGIYDEAFVVGATDMTEVLASFSGRGPVTVDGSGRLRPDVVAPGVGVRSSVRGGFYSHLSGTSMASPHVAGAAALLWSVKPALKGLVATTRCLISQSARGNVQQSTPQTCGGTSGSDRPNNLFGFGLIDAYDAIHLGPDTDADGVADACDCAPSDAGVFAPPAEPSALGLSADKQTITWSVSDPAGGSATVYDVIAGDLSNLRATGLVASAVCLGSSSATPLRTDPVVPPVGSGTYYVIQARNGCGTSGFGVTSGGIPRAHASCP
ncbi:MAG TPA: S8 family serine peptidase [Candidatus Polarisedimenticolaceae bacterium]|nr:S8 family serine peptidase [Candidatus Polarisedimenticolaceae bacterium]